MSYSASCLHLIMLIFLIRTVQEIVTTAWSTIEQADIGTPPLPLHFAPPPLPFSNAITVIFLVDAARRIDENVIHIMHQLETNLAQVRKQLKIKRQSNLDLPEEPENSEESENLEHAENSNAAEEVKPKEDADKLESAGKPKVEHRQREDKEATRGRKKKSKEVAKEVAKEDREQGVQAEGDKGETTSKAEAGGKGVQEKDSQKEPTVHQPILKECILVLNKVFSFSPSHLI